MSPVDLVTSMVNHTEILMQIGKNRYQIQICEVGWEEGTGVHYVYKGKTRAGQTVTGFLNGKTYEATTSFQK